MWRTTTGSAARRRLTPRRAVASSSPTRLRRGASTTTRCSGPQFSGNGHAGVALHAHAPGTNFSGNVIAWNVIGRNNLRTDTDDLKTTGVYLADASPLTITVIGNIISNNYYGIFTAGSVIVKGALFNGFVNVVHATGSYPTY